MSEEGEDGEEGGADGRPVKKKKNRVHISVAMKKRDKILSRKDKQRHTRLK